MIDSIVRELNGEFIGSYMLEDEPWQFYDLAVIKAPDGYYISTDSGCSCPTPFESHSVSDFTGPITQDAVVEEYKSLANVDGQYSRLYPEAFKRELARLESEL